MDSLENIRKLIKKHNTVSTVGIGYAGTPSKFWYAFAYMVYLSTEKELIEALEEKSPALKVYAYIGLVQNKYPDTTVFQNKLLQDNSELNSISGCILEETTVKECVLPYKKLYSPDLLHRIVAKLQSEEKYKNELYEDLIYEKQIKKSF